MPAPRPVRDRASASSSCIRLGISAPLFHRAEADGRIPASLGTASRAVVRPPCAAAPPALRDPSIGRFPVQAGPLRCAAGCRSLRLRSRQPGQGPCRPMLAGSRAGWGWPHHTGGLDSALTRYPVWHTGAYRVAKRTEPVMRGRTTMATVSVTLDLDEAAARILKEATPEQRRSLEALVSLHPLGSCDESPVVARADGHRRRAGGSAGLDQRTVAGTAA